MKQDRPKWISACARRAIIGSIACAVSGLLAASSFAQTSDGSQGKFEPDSQSEYEKAEYRKSASEKTQSKSTNDEVSPLQQMAMDAGSAQAAGDLKRAAGLWVKLLEQDVDAIVRCRAHFSAGLCYSQLRDFEPSIFHFKKGLEVATPESAAEVPQALFYLGYGQLEFGRQLQAASIASANGKENADQARRAMELLTTSSQTLGRLQRRFPDFAGADQAAFFQGKAFELLGRLEQAAESYRQVLAAEQAAFTADARFGLADTLTKLGQPSDALNQYRLLIAAADQLKPQQKPLLVESQFRAAEVLMSLGEARRESGDAESAEEDFALAFELYSSVVDQEASLPKNSQLVPLAMYGAAWSQLNSAVGKNQVVAARAADQWFSRLIDGWPDHELFADATAGRDSARQLVDLLAAQTDDSPIADFSPVGEASDEKQPNDSLVSADNKEQSRFELGLERVEQTQWNDAIEVFEQLIADFPDSRDVDRYRYELAWALRSATPAQTQRSLEQFAAIADSTPDSSFAAEAHFHLGSADYDRGQYELAADHFAIVLDAELPPKVLERARYQLGWSEYRLEKFASAAEQFRRQLDAFPDGPMATDAKVMFAESQFQQDKHAAALAAYRVAKPAVDADGNIDPKMQVLTALHGAQSANESQEFEEAIRFANPVTVADDIPEAYQMDAWLEIGIAQAGQGNQAAAIESWQKAVASMSVTGAKARSLLGEALASERQYQDALNQFKLVYFGFGGVDAEAEIRPWQAYALYEAARLNQSLCRDASGPVLRQRIDEAIGQYQRLLKNYGDSDLAEEAERQLTKLEKF